jgi:CHAD domain-containing protein
MRLHEAGTMAGHDPEDLHDMRALGGCLGAVRDLDVLLVAARAHQLTLAAAEAGAFQDLVDAWERRRDTARVQMLEYLGGRTYADFKERYASFLDTPGAGARARAADVTPRPTLVAHVLRSKLWMHYESLSAFEPVLPWASAETLHALRIEGKRCVTCSSSSATSSIAASRRQSEQSSRCRTSWASYRTRS